MIDIQKLKNSWMFGFFERRHNDAPETKESYIEWCVSPIKNLIINNLKRDGIHIRNDKEYTDVMRTILDLVFMDENDILFYTQDNP